MVTDNTDTKMGDYYDFRFSRMFILFQGHPMLKNLKLSEANMRARQLGIPFRGTPGKFNAITDVQGVEVGHCTIIKGEGKLIVGQGPIRTGVTGIFPLGKTPTEVFAAFYSYNGNGEMTGAAWIEETGHLKGPICITNTHSVGTVRDAVIEWRLKRNLIGKDEEFFWELPVIAETYDGILNDINGFHVKSEHVFQVLDDASSGQVKEGNVGGGTGMVCHQFKGGIGTSSRRVLDKFMLGALVQCNYGIRQDLTIAGVPVGEELAGLLPEINTPRFERDYRVGSIIVILAIDAPLLPYQLKRLVKRIPAGIAKVGGYGGHFSGDLFLAFSTANILNNGSGQENPVMNVKTLGDPHMTPLFKAVADATEEAIINALISAKTMTGINNNTVYSLPHSELKEVLEKYNRLL
ncbi:MAG: P1 family peptidase [Candidatus Heimdallarchaeota archaeon]